MLACVDDWTSDVMLLILSLSFGDVAEFRGWRLEGDTALFNCRPSTLLLSRQKFLTLHLADWVALHVRTLVQYSCRRCS